MEKGSCFGYDMYIPNQITSEVSVNAADLKPGDNEIALVIFSTML